MAVVNSTFSGNSAGFFGGNILNGSVANLKATILALSSSGGNCSAENGITDSGYNLSDDDSCSFSATGSENNVSDADLELAVADQQRRPNSIRSRSSDHGSVALDAIPVASCLYANVNPCINPPTISAGSSGPLLCDQLGEPRPDSGESACAIGAFEPQILTEFEEFQTGLIVFPNQFAAGGSFTLGADSVFNPPTQAVTVTIASAAFGPLVATIPAGHFTLVKGQYKYSGTLGGIKYGVTFFAPVNGVYQFTFAAFGVDVTGITNPVSVTLQIGPNIGTDDDVAAAIPRLVGAKRRAIIPGASATDAARCQVQLHQ